MINKILNWFLLSSQNPQEAALTAKGLTSLGVVVLVFNSFLPSVGVHIPWDLNTIGDSVYNLLYAVLTAVSAGVSLVGVVRKLWNTFAVPKDVPKV